jgi:hypothetical protein
MGPSCRQSSKQQYSCGLSWMISFRIRRYAIALFGGLLSSMALADNARDWQALPTDLNMFFAYYSNVNATTSINTHLPFDGVNTDANLAILRYAHTFALDGRLSAIQVIQPYAKIDLSLSDAEQTSGSRGVSNLGDTQVVLVHNLTGGPALDKAAFQRWSPEPFITGALWITLPTGSYDKHKSMNVGTNRWAFKPEITTGYPLGSLWFEFNTWATFFTDNTEYHDNQTLSQRPQYAAEGHISYTINPAIWISADGTWAGGGETKIGNDVQNNQQQSTALGTTLGFMLTPQFGGMVSWSKTVDHRSYTTPNLENWTFRLEYAW